jgi:glycosyltransferase involved in cell wall biosynthesis
VPRSLRLNPEVREALPYVVSMLDQVRRRAPEFDVLHFHLDYLHYPLFRDLVGRTLTTQHGRLDLPDLPIVATAFADYPQVSISDHQRRPCPNRNWVRTVYHGLPEDLYPFSPVPEEGYLAFLGRICPEKRADVAIEIACRAGRPLKIAAKVDRVDETYFEEVIRPLLQHPLVEFIGEIGEAEKNAFLGNARALLFPIDWPEPFGLVMTEAMACGTPTVAYRCGSVPEIIDHGLTGFIVEGEDAAVEAVDQAASLDRATCRRIFERRFSSDQMASAYSRVYQRVIGRKGGMTLENSSIEKDERAA